MIYVETAFHVTVPLSTRKGEMLCHIWQESPSAQGIEGYEKLSDPIYEYSLL